jgi:hypothetical protein
MDTNHKPPPKLESKKRPNLLGNVYQKKSRATYFQRHSHRQKTLKEDGK